MTLAVVGFLLAVADLVGLVVYARLRRAHRQRVWLTSPRDLLDIAPHSPFPAAFGVGGGLLAAAFALCRLDHWSTPLTIAMAAGAIMGWAHIWNWLLASTIGLAVAMSTLIAICVAWIWGLPSGSPPGAAFASAWAWWLAAFWRQQVGAAGPWTTAGRLIPSALWIGVAFSAATVAMLIEAALSGRAHDGSALITAVVGLGLSAAQSRRLFSRRPSMSVRMAASRGSA